MAFAGPAILRGDNQMLTRETQRRVLARVIDASGRRREPREPDDEAGRLSRRTLLERTGMLADAAALASSPALLGKLGAGAAAYADGPDIVTDTFNGLVAFIVPGPDPYSAQQGVSTPEPGGIAAFASPALIGALDFIQLAPPPFPTFGDLVAFILNNVAEVVHPGVTGPFGSPFANLAFGEKVAVFAALEGGLIDPALAPLGGALPYFTAFTAYSEVGVFNPATGALVGEPVGWAISGYDGISDGHDEFIGYFGNRRKAS
jgi:hypothetical protein